MSDRVVDYAWSRPSSLDAYAGVMRYLSHDPSKDLSPAERDAVRAQGKTIGLVFESTANRAAQGFDAGQADAIFANQRADELGYPRGCTLWYAVDFDGSPAQVQPYFDGVASVGGRPYAPYGSFRIVEGVRYPGIAWQTAAWSGGRVSARAGLLQDKFAGSFDENRILIAAYGAWGAEAETDELDDPQVIAAIARSDQRAANIEGAASRLEGDVAVLKQSAAGGKAAEISEAVVSELAARLEQ